MHVRRRLAPAAPAALLVISLLQALPARAAPPPGPPGAAQVQVAPPGPPPEPLPASERVPVEADIEEDGVRDPQEALPIDIPPGVDVEALLAGLTPPPGRGRPRLRPLRRGR